MLVRLTYEYARTGESKDIFLRAFFTAMELSMDGQDGADLADPDIEVDVGLALRGFADFLFDNFFLPCTSENPILCLSHSPRVNTDILPVRTASNKTLQPSPPHYVAVRRAQDAALLDSSVGTPDRLSELREFCLIRDRHRCVVSRRFDANTAIQRMESSSDDAEDDDGNPLQGQDFDYVEVAHILPHSLTQMGNSVMVRHPILF